MLALQYVRKEEYRLSLQELADKIGVSKQILNRWEREEKKIPENRIADLEAFTGVSRDYLLMNTELLSDIDKLEIHSSVLQKEINEMTVEYETVDENGNKYVTWAFTQPLAEYYIDEISKIDKKIKEKKRINELILSIEKYGGSDRYLRLSKLLENKDAAYYIDICLEAIKKLYDETVELSDIETGVFAQLMYAKNERKKDLDIIREYKKNNGK